IDVPADDIIQRLSGRRSCPGCGASYHVAFSPPRVPDVCDHCGKALVQREGDRAEAGARRLEGYQRDTAPLVDDYAARGALRRVDGVGPLEEILDRIAACLEP